MNENKGDLKASRMPRAGARYNFNKYFKYIAISLVFIITILSVSTTVLAVKFSELKNENEILVDEKVQLTMYAQEKEQEIEILKEEKETLNNNIEELLSEAEMRDKLLAATKKQLNEALQKLAKSSVSYNNSWGQFKSFMDYRKITSVNSKQYKLQYGLSPFATPKAQTDPNTGVRTIDGDYCIAIGSGWGYEIGTKVLVTLKSGKTFNAIVADAKSNIHTELDNKTCKSNGSVIEFIVDQNKLPLFVYGSDKASGTLSSLEMFNGGIVSITKR